MRLLQLWFLIALICSGSGLGQTTQPAEAPSDEQIASLVRQLGDSSFQVRQEATQRLMEIGKPALPALKEAASSDDPEIQSRAEMLIRRLSKRPVPQAPAHAEAGPASGHRSVRISVVNGEKVVDIDDNGQKIHIEEGPGGIEMTVTGQVDGRQVTEKYQAASAEDLRREEPEAYELYTRSLREPGLLNLELPLGGRWRPWVAVPEPGHWPGPLDTLDELEARLEEQLAKARVPEEQRRRIFDQLNKLRDARDVDPAPKLADRDRQQMDLWKHSDELRKKLQEMRLPDPGELLPPPPNARLGVLLEQPAQDQEPSGVRIHRVMVGSRAEKLGLQAGDIIQKIDDTPVRSVQDLHKALRNSQPPIVVQILRNGKEMQLNERPPDKASQPSSMP